MRDELKSALQSAAAFVPLKPPYPEAKQSVEQELMRAELIRSYDVTIKARG